MKYFYAAFSTLIFLPNALAQLTQTECTASCEETCANQNGLILDQCIVVDCYCACLSGSVASNGASCGVKKQTEEFLACFSSQTTAGVKGKGIVSMKEIRVGDQVLTSTGNYETVYAIDHRHSTKSVEFIQIYTDTQKVPLELTSNHMLFLQGNPNPVPASMVKIGDQVQTLEGPSTVTKVETITRAGLFSPLTTDGTIVASGVIASSYSAHFSSSEWIEVAGMKLMSHQSFFDKALKPYKYMCTGLSLELCKTDKEKVAISQLANDLFDQLIQCSGLFFSVALTFAVLGVLMLDFILSPQAFILAVSLVSVYKMTNKENTKIF